MGDPTDQGAIEGTTTLEDGSFELKTDATDFYIEVSFMGFTAQRFEDPEITDGEIDLGTITLQEDAQQLSEVVVEGQVSQTQFKLDKRIFNVGADLSSTGASALEVLNNVSVRNGQYRGAGQFAGQVRAFQMLINGKPSVIANEQGNALGTLTADMIERVEVITKPLGQIRCRGHFGHYQYRFEERGKKRDSNGSVTPKYRDTQ